MEMKKVNRNYEKMMAGICPNTEIRNKASGIN
jgi:hypothetical protein